MPVTDPNRRLALKVVLPPGSTEADLPDWRGAIIAGLYAGPANLSDIEIHDTTHVDQLPRP